MYFLRLAKLKPAVEQVAAEAWDDFEVNDSSSPQNIVRAKDEFDELIRCVSRLLEINRDRLTEC